MTYIEYIKLLLLHSDYDEKWKQAKHLDYKQEKKMEEVLNKIKKEQDEQNKK